MDFIAKTSQIQPVYQAILNLEKDYCESINGHLVNINSPEENDRIQEDLQKDPSSIAYWTGGYDSGRGVTLPIDDLHEDVPGYFLNSTGFWTWDVKTAPWNFLHWDTNFPNLAESVKTCVQIVAATGKWENINCATRMYAICQKTPIVNDVPD